MDLLRHSLIMIWQWSVIIMLRTVDGVFLEQFWNDLTFLLAIYKRRNESTDSIHIWSNI